MELSNNGGWYDLATYMYAPLMALRRWSSSSLIPGVLAGVAFWVAISSAVNNRCPSDPAKLGASG